VKILLWLAIGMVVVFWLLPSKKTLKAHDPSQHNTPGASTSGGAESMVPCAHCGVHIPVSEAVVGPSGAAFCSDEHRRLHA
jgi:uncharacterized protein